MRSPPSSRRRGALASFMVLPLVLLGRAAAQPSSSERSKQRPEQAVPPALQGIDADGRIPKVELPADIPNPERWRYVPPGRIVDGNVFERFLISSFVVPVLFFEEDIGAGAGLSITDIDFRSQRRREFGGIFFSYTTEGQQRYSLVWQRWLHHRELEGGGIIHEERSFLRGSIGYERTLTRRFFGLGSRTEESDETSYTDERTSLSVRLRQSVPEPGSDWVFSIGATIQHRNLSRGRVSSAPSTELVFPELVQAADSHDSLSLAASLSFDTRDSQHNPYRGWAVGGRTIAYPAQSGGDVGAIMSLFATAVTPVPPLLHDGGDPDEENPPTDTLAVAVTTDATAGNLPFWALPSLGGPNRLRGFIANRFTDRAAWHAVAEHRFWVVPRGFRLSERIRIERLGLALFGEVGTVADSFGDLWDARIQTSYGFGLRMTLERLALFRADFGFSGEGLNLTFRYGLSF